MPAFPSELLDSLAAARHLLVFTGAGVSAESGIPTFRDAMSGLWSRFDAAELATPDAFRRDPALVWGWYEWRRMKVLQAQPNPAHEAIAQLARRLPALTLVTQNVDDLHERAGSQVAARLHGSLHRPRCFACDTPAHFDPGSPAVADAGARVDPPRCPDCGGPIRPGVVWFGESLPEADWGAAMAGLEAADMVISVGTSSLVFPAAEIPAWAARAGLPVVQINPQPTRLDELARFNLAGPAGAVLPALVRAAFGSA
jgi:NAD-dependent deacetylase